MRPSILRTRTQSVRLRARPLAAVFAVCVALAATLSAGVGAAQSGGATTHAEYDITHTDLIAGTLTPTSDMDPGRDDASSILMTGTLSALYGDHDVRLEAQVTSTDDGTIRLGAKGEHGFDLTGIDFQNRWETVVSNLLASAEFVDTLTISGVPGSSATVEFYFQIRGETEVEINQGFSDLWLTADTNYRLEATTASPHSGGGTHNGSVGWPTRYVYASFADKKVVDDYVVLSLDVDPSEEIPFEIYFEIDQRTDLNGSVEGANLQTNGFHRPQLYDLGAELLGVVVKDQFGLVFPNATIDSDGGYDYPVEAEPPPPILPSHVIVSPIAIADTDLGEYDPSQVPLSQMIDQSGLHVPFVSGQTGFDYYFSQAEADRSDVGFQNNWQSEVSFDLPLQGYVDFDLGEELTIDRLGIWNISLEDIRVEIADSPTGPWSEIGQFTLSSNINVLGYHRVQTLDLGGPRTGRYLRINVDSAHLYDNSFTYAVVGEVVVSSLTPVPEPGGLAMLASGVAAVVSVAGRRRARASRGSV